MIVYIIVLRALIFASIMCSEGTTLFPTARAVALITPPAASTK